MQKIGVILIFVFFVVSCSVTRKSGDRYTGAEKRMSRNDVLSGTENLNITNNNFFIQKAEISVINEDGTQKFIGSIKFEKPDRYLLSLRSRTGIEGARIFISGDTVMINDRIDRVFYYGSSQALKRNYGVSASLLHVVLGDFFSKYIHDFDASDCIEGKLKVERVIEGIRLTSVIDCKLMKAVSVIPDDSKNSRSLEIQFDDFFRENESVVPGKILVFDKGKSSRIEINIEKIEVPWSGTIEFVPGLNYEKLKIP